MKIKRIAQMIIIMSAIVLFPSITIEAEESVIYVEQFPMEQLEEDKSVEDEVIEKQNEINQIEDRKQRFIAYKELINQYQDTECFGRPETIYDYYSMDEIKVFQRIVEAECTGLDFEQKVNVSNVILNRIADNRFPSGITEVVFQKNPTQFSPIKDGRYLEVNITEDTVLAVEYAFMFPDTTDGALYFEAVWSESLNYLCFIFSDGYHKFYK